MPEKNEELSNENIKTKDLKKKYKYAKSSVDDRFFSLAEMEDFLNKEEPTCQREVLESIVSLLLVIECNLFFLNTLLIKLKFLY